MCVAEPRFDIPLLNNCLNLYTIDYLECFTLMDMETEASTVRFTLEGLPKVTEDTIILFNEQVCNPDYLAEADRRFMEKQRTLWEHRNTSQDNRINTYFANGKPRTANKLALLTMAYGSAFRESYYLIRAEAVMQNSGI